MIKIAIVEDHVLSLNALEDKLSAFREISILFTAENGIFLLDKLSENEDVDLILMDIEMPGMNGIQATARVKQQYPGIKIVMITIYDDDDCIFNAIKAGADSYILKETKAEKIYETILDTLQGGSVMSPSIALKTLKLLKSISSLTEEQHSEKIRLSEREVEILEQLSKGFTNKRIAELLIISPLTVKRHIENIYQKLQTHNRIQLIEKARKNGLI